ncbi:MAG: hypothetical protein M3O89_04765 [Actinomycetota bacterium]|nr:hypothetical protein [Actinomycetota bacterium]
MFAFIESAGLDVARFEWKALPSRFRAGGTVSALQLRSTPYFIAFDFQNDVWNRVTFYSPGDSEMVERAEAASWDDQLRHVRNWIAFMKRELEAPDLWATASNEAALLALPDQRKNTRFTARELRLIHAQLQEFKQFLEKNANATTEGLASIDQRLNYLEDAAKRQGRVDWKNIAVSTVLGIAWDLGSDPVKGHAIIAFFAQAFASLFGGHLALPQ